MRFPLPQLSTISIQVLPEDSSLGLRLCHGPDGIPEIQKIATGKPASRSPLKVGFQILIVEGHRVKNTEKCVELLNSFRATKSSIEVVVAEGALPPGAKYVMVKADARKRTTFGDGSVQGLFLEERGDGGLRVVDISENGIFARAKIYKRDTILSINGHAVDTVQDCKNALTMSSSRIVTVVTFNVFRKAKSSFMAAPTSTAEVCMKTQGDLVRSQKSIEDMYQIGAELGSGAFGTVHMAKARDTGKAYAVKIINRAALTTNLEYALKQEISILNELDHPDILRLVSTFSTPESHYLVTELLEGGELFDRICEKTKYSESEARDVSRNLLEAVAYCHSKNICHRDLKPENILLSDKDDDCQIKIIDFGLSRKAPKDDSLKTMCGSPYYISPEILLGHRYGVKTDVWALGVIIFILLGGYPPFSDESRGVQNQLIINCKYEFQEDTFGMVSQDTKDLIASLLVIDPQARFSASEALKHPWFIIDQKSLKTHSLTECQRSIEVNFLKAKFTSAVNKLIAVNRIRNCVVGRIDKSIVFEEDSMNGESSVLPKNYLFHAYSKEMVTRPSRSRAA